MNKASVVRRCLGGAGLGLAGMYAFHMARYRRAAGKGFDMPDPPAVGSSEFTAFVEALTQASSREGNRLEILRNGCEIFPAMLETINSARECIDFSTYIYWTGDIAPKFADALIAKASAGVEVNVVLDAQGSVKMDHGIIDRMRAAGATVVWFRPPHWYNVHKLNKRMHRRILIVDGKVGFMGGVGIAEEWDGNAEDQEHQRETHVRIAGPAVRDLMGGVPGELDGRNICAAVCITLPGHRRLQRLDTGSGGPYRVDWWAAGTAGDALGRGAGIEETFLDNDGFLRSATCLRRCAL